MNPKVVSCKWQTGMPLTSPCLRAPLPNFDAWQHHWCALGGVRKSSLRHRLLL